MKIIVTGGAGFIASHVTDLYIEHGHEVVVVDNLSTGQPSNVNSKAQLIQADITDQATISTIIQRVKPQVINHHAAHIQVGNSVKHPQFDAMNNVIGLLNIVESAREAGVERLIMASTGGAMYGDQPVPFNESMAASPLSPYGVSKRAGELYLNYYFQEYDLPYVALRYSNVYGPRQNPHGESGVIAIFSEKIVNNQQPIINGNGENTRDYVFVSDVAQANLLALGTTFVGCVNIGTGTEISTNQVFEAVVDEFKVDVLKEHGPARPGEQQRSSLDASLAEKELGWKPVVTFDEGVTQVVEWYKSANS